MPALETVNLNLGVAVIAMQILTAGLLIVFLFKHKISALRDIAESVSSWGMWAGLFLSLGASAMTLIHSSIFNLPPCPLCWWQRIFLYPQAVIFTIALWKRDANAACYSIALSIVGLTVSLYHHALQIAPSGTLPCPADGTVSCSQVLFLEFGYITYPLMGASLFAFLIVVMLFVRRR